MLLLFAVPLCRRISGADSIQTRSPLTIGIVVAGWVLGDILDLALRVFGVTLCRCLGDADAVVTGSTLAVGVVVAGWIF